eukprot:1613034-Rhodomonas_salina.2
MCIRDRGQGCHPRVRTKGLRASVRDQMSVGLKCPREGRDSDGARSAYLRSPDSAFRMLERSDSVR